MKEKKSQTLNLDGLIPSLEEDAEAYAGLNARAQQWIHKIGLRLPEQPMKEGKPLQPKIPRNPDGSPSFEPLQLKDLTKLSAELLSYHQYGTTQLGDLKISKLALQEELSLLESKLHVLLKPPESSKKMRIKNDPRFLKLKQKLVEVEAKMALLGPLMDGVEEEMKLISREITVRTTEVDNVSRDNNLAKPREKRKNVPGGRRIR